MRSLVPIALVALLAASLPATSASDNVTVIATFGAGTYLAAGAPCVVSVPAGADGAAVLDAAVAAGCISSWSSKTFSFGRFVSCIDDICGIDDTGQVNGAAAGLDGTFWELSVDHHITDYGIDGYHAKDLDVVGFTYEDFFASFVDFEASSSLP